MWAARQIGLSRIGKRTHSIRSWPDKTVKCFSRCLFDSINLSIAINAFRLVNARRYFNTLKRSSVSFFAGLKSYWWGILFLAFRSTVFRLRPRLVDLWPRNQSWQIASDSRRLSKIDSDRNVQREEWMSHYIDLEINLLPYDFSYAARAAGNLILGWYLGENIWKKQKSLWYFNVCLLAFSFKRVSYGATSSFKHF